MLVTLGSLQAWGNIPRTDGGPLDVGDHIGNVGLSQLLGGVAAPVFAKIAEALPGKPTPRRVLAGAVAGAVLVGAAANALVETKTGMNVLKAVTGSFADTHPWFRDMTDGNPSGWDFVYGEAGSITSAAVVTADRLRDQEPEMALVAHAIEQPGTLDDRVPNSLSYR